MTPTKEFRRAFKIVCDHYQCPPHEVDQMKQLVRDHYEEAERCYFALVKEVFPAFEINTRIQADIAAHPTVPVLEAAATIQPTAYERAMEQLDLLTRMAA